MRVGIAACMQETNSFSPAPSTPEAFERGYLLDGDAMLRMAGTNTEIAGFIDGLAAVNVGVVPLMAAWAMSGGPLEDGALAVLRARLGRALAGAGRLDAVLIALHGATAAISEPDVAGAILGDLRHALGGAPIVATLDLHANVTRRMTACADALIGYQTSPHVDYAQTGGRAVGVLLRMRRGRRPAMVARKVPMLLPAERLDTSEGPLARLVARARAAEARGAWSVSVFPMQPWLDVPEGGFGVVAIDDDAARAQTVADDLAREAWAARGAFGIDLVAPEEAVRRALAAPAGPVVLVDSADAMSSGAPGDSTVLLRALLQAAPSAPVLMTLRDPDAPGQAAAAGVGATLDLTVGAKYGRAFYDPVAVRADVVAVSDGVFRMSAATLRGVEMRMGAAAALRVGGLTVVVHEAPTPTSDPALYRSLGLDPSAAQAIVVKHPIGWRVGIGEIAASAIYVDLPGASTPRLDRLPFARVPRPIWPLDPDSAVAASIGSRIAPPET